MKNIRKVAVEILQAVLEEGKYSNIVLSNKLNNLQIDNIDKGLITEIVYGTIKYKYTIDKILNSLITKGTKRMDSYILNLLRISVYQIKYLDRVPDYAIVNEAVELSKKVNIGASKLVNGVLRNFIRNKNNITMKFNNYIDELSFQYSYPQWMVKLFINQYGENEAKNILENLNKRPDITVRVNSTKCTYKEAWETLKELGYNIEKGSVSKEAIRIISGKNIEKNQLFNEGKITVQDESSMLVAPTLDPKKSMTILDLCSAPGGKATHICEIINDNGTVNAYDIHENKLKLIEENVTRLGLTNVITEQMDATQLNKKLVNTADRVLIDVPCSGLGIIKKKPEIKWNKNHKSLNELIPIQREIMKNASKYLVKGGIMVYSTCTLNKCENEENIEWFLKEHPDFELLPINIDKGENVIYQKNGCVTIIPNEYMDGFFIAKLIKK